MFKQLINSFGCVLMCLLLTGIQSNIAPAADASAYLAVTHPIPGGLMSEDGRGAFADLCQAIFQRIPYKVTVKVYPTKRAMMMFTEKDASIYVATLEEHDPAFLEVPMGLVSFKLIVTRDDQPILSTVRELEGKVIGIRRGWSYPPELMENPTIRKAEVETFEQNIKKLQAGRIDAAILSSTDLSDLEAKKFFGIHYDLEKRVFLKKAVFRFHADEKGKKLADAFQTALAALKKDGGYEKIFQPYQIPRWEFE